jgi:hypothetical protein
MSLLLALVLTASPVVEDPRGFHFTVPEGFEAFPGFVANEKKLYAFGKNLGTAEAITVTLDLVEGPATAGTPSASCGALMNSIDRTLGSGTQEQWRGATLVGLRMLMTHVFGEVLVLCVDVPMAPKGLSLMVSGKPGHEAALRETFNAMLSSISPVERGFPFSPVELLAAIVAVLFPAWFVRRVRASASRSSP